MSEAAAPRALNEAGQGRDPQALADKVREGLYARDRAAQALGILVADMGPGRATLTMRVREDMLNGFGICHGGFIAALADTAFAYACNSGNEQTVASGISVDFVAPGRAGDLLTAAAREVAAAGRTGVYDIEVTNQEGELIAVMRGRSWRTMGRPVVEI